jgi:hypothetical protein
MIHTPIIVLKKQKQIDELITRKMKSEVDRVPCRDPWRKKREREEERDRRACGKPGY